MSVVQQGQVTPSTPSKRKSFSILTPISPNRMLQHQRSLLKSPEKRERKISESTGLAKFSLANSPAKKDFFNKSESNTNTTPRSGLPVYVPIRSPPSELNTPPRTMDDLQTESRRLLEQYTTKQAQLHEYERLVEVKKMQLLELTQKIEAIKREEVILSKHGNGDIYKQAHLETERELNKLNIVSTAENNDKENNRPSLTKQVSQVFEVKTSTIKKQASFIMNQAFDDLNHNVKKSTSTIFSPQRNEDFKQLIQQSNVKFDDLAKQTSKFFNDVTSNFNDNIFNFNKNKSPSKISESFVADSSFIFDNLKESLQDEIDTNSIIYERSFEDSQEHIDIDDYDSSFD
ncbi:uncharacterized protein SPAPADRAFT_54374 [Spathaspora passalidarum NRRL Y-27907]|uniref:Uncharacterized protein n=1 Tax=Spathaspora passalidarum (strain NRRL Y-27907 / 11-Y1) TaxID=619300 RepID=G3AHN8_SPAPN|nr:uncharacterized protein SPAPADRAFT_54374 [Spathaspora passalidarum NRRL Y-27907]EGW34202.1 hypothetical protein SPAPADRAFT_54374 [Spathaspora passalidarum NRRL Y-27907]